MMSTDTHSLHIYKKNNGTKEKKNTEKLWLLNESKITNIKMQMTNKTHTGDILN